METKKIKLNNILKPVPPEDVRYTRGFHGYEFTAEDPNGMPVEIFINTEKNLMTIFHNGNQLTVGKKAVSNLEHFFTHPDEI